MSAQHVPVLNKKLEGFTNEELQKELAVRQAMLASWTGSPSPAEAATSVQAAMPPPTTKTTTATTKSTRRRSRRGKGAPKKIAGKKNGAGAAAPVAGTPGAPKKRMRRGISPSGKTTAQYAIDALASLGGARAPAELVPLMKKAGWVSKSSDEAAVVTTTMKKAAAQKLVKKLAGQNKFRSLAAAAE